MAQQRPQNKLRNQAGSQGQELDIASLLKQIAAGQAELQGAVTQLASTVGQQQVEIERMRLLQAAPKIVGTAPPVYTEQVAQQLVKPQEDPQGVREAEAEKAATRHRLNNQPWVEVLIEEEHAVIHGGLKIAFAPKGEIISMPQELAQVYRTWRQGQADIFRFAARMKQAGGNEGLIPLQQLDSVIGTDDLWGGR